MNKLKVMAVGFVFCIGILIGTLIPERNSEYKQLVKIAEMQAVKIAVIEQAAKLDNYTAQLQKMQRSKANIATPVVTDPKDVNDSR